MPYGNFYYGKNGFFFKKSGAIGARYNPSLAAICNQPQDLNNRYISGSGVGAVTVSNRRAQINRAAKCNPFCPTKMSTDVCSLLPSSTPYQVCSPWPQFGGLFNNQQRRTPIVASQTGNILWQSQNTNNLILITTSSPIIASDGTIYIGYTLFDINTNPQASYFAALNSNGTVKWLLQLDARDINARPSSAIGPDGTNYLVANNDIENVPYLYAVNSFGIKKWKLRLSLSSASTASIAIGNNGEIFVCGYNVSFQGVIYGVNQNGILISGYPIILDNTQNPGWNSIITDGPAISRNGKLYICNYDESAGNNGALYCVDTITKNKIWEFNVTDGVPYSIPALSNDESTVYFTFNTTYSTVADTLYAVNSKDGTIKWQYNTSVFQLAYDSVSETSIAIGSDDTIYVIVFGYANNTVGNFYAKLVALDSYGNKKWTYIFGDISNSTGSYVFTSPVIGGDGTIYVGVEIYDVDSIDPGNPITTYLTMFAITPSGQLKWRRITTSAFTYNQSSIITYATSPAIGLDGTIYIGVNYQDRINKTGYSKLYAIN